MVIQSLFNHSFLRRPEECDILSELSTSSRKAISIEVEQNLTYRLMCAVSDNPDEALKKGPLGLPMLLEPEGIIDWKLPTWQHVKWTLHSLAPIFGLSFESLASISNAVKIYCLWLKSPHLRPACVTPENESQFITTILLDLSELFVARKLADSKTVTIAACKRHAELCNMVIKTVMNDFIPESALLKEKASETWNMLTSLILGITDDLLWRDGQNYLADDLSEPLLLSCFTCLLKSNIYSGALWKKVTECFRLWCHRVKSVLVWGSVIVPMTQEVAAVLNSENAEKTLKLTIGLHAPIIVDIDNEFLVFSWSKLSKLLPKLPSMTSEVFLRSAQVIEKVLSIWLNCSSVPDIVTLFILYGDNLFEACSFEKAGFDAGRAILYTSLCKLLSRPQYRIVVDEKYLNVSFLCLQKALSSDGLILDSVLVNLEAVLLSNQPGVRCLIPFIYEACRRVIKQFVNSKPSITDNIRMVCYRLLNMIGMHYRSDLVAISDPAKFESMNGLYSDKIFTTNDLSSSQIFFRMIFDILVVAISSEDSMTNVRFLLNASCALSRTDPFLVPILAKILEEALYLEKWNTETLLTTVRCIEQLSKHRSFPLETVKRTCLSLMTLAESLFAKNQLSQSYFLLIAIYEASFSWINAMDQFNPDCVANALATLTKFISTLEKPTDKSKKPQHESNATVLGNQRKSLTSRVFSSDSRDEEARPVTISPNTQKNIEEMIVEHTSSTIQRLMNLLLDDLVQKGSLCQIDFLNEFSPNAQFKYFALSSSVLIGYCDDVIVMRNAVRRFAWKLSFLHAKNMPLKVFASAQLVSNFARLDIESRSGVALFDREKVVDECQPIDEDILLLNDEGWNSSLHDNSVYCEQILDVLDNARANFESIVTSLPKQALQITPQTNHRCDSSLQPSTLFSHLGLTLPSTRGILMPLPTSSELQSDLKHLDSMNFKQEITIPVEYYVESTSSKTIPFSQSFADFVNSLGSVNENESCKRSYDDHSVHVSFPVSSSVHESSVAIIWSENGEAVNKLPEIIPPNSSTFVYFVIVPVLIGDSTKGHFYQVRILLSKSAPSETESFMKYTNIFGPVFDGIILSRSELSSMVTETAISAHLFVLRFIQNKPSPVTKRAAWIRSIVFKNYQNLALNDFYASLLSE